MSPELRVYVPERQMGYFRSTIANVEGAEIISVFPSSRDGVAEAELKGMPDAPAMLAQFRNESDPKRQSVIVDGIRKLLDATSITHPRREYWEGVHPATVARLSTEEEIARARAALSDIFSGLLPKEVAVIMLRYGLTGEPPLTLRKTAELLGWKSQEAARRVQSITLGKLRHPKNSEPIKKAVTAEVIEE